MARRQVFAFGSAETMEEAREITTELIHEVQPRHSATVRLTWYLDKLRLVTPAPLGKQRSRDAKDDCYIAAALAARVDYLVSFDRDLRSLQKPFGIAVITPAQLLKSIKG